MWYKVLRQRSSVTFTAFTDNGQLALLIVRNLEVEIIILHNELWLPGEVWWDWCGNKRLHGFPMDLLEHEQDLWTL